MSTESRRKSLSIIERLTERPYEYSFTQAVRLLERATALNKKEDKLQANRPIARFMPPSAEFLRFKTHQSFAFPSSEIASIRQSLSNDNTRQWQMIINFMGISGSSGYLPFHYTEMALQRLKLKDGSMIDFFDLFNHRIISLFYQASCKYSLPMAYERKRLESPDDNRSDNVTQALLSLIGIGTRGSNNRLHIKDESLVYYAGLFMENVRSASGLKQILQNHFSIPVEIEDFIGQWQPLIDDVRTRLSVESSTAQNNCLGKNAILGSKGWYVQGKIRIILGPLNKSQLSTFSPGTNTLRALDEVVRLYLGIEHDYDFVMRIKRQDIPKQVGLSSQQPAVVGWNTWLSSKPAERDIEYQNKMVDIPVSARRLN
ncbi:MAG: type VI secretion system baseplate subunit TssG [Thiotrichaceae bacterium]|nr:type VI secretion system baseplate subunit TssG [Thiotrichaceae bacterium]MBL1262052.1 type VI secretion system baseplate subunit TssG [Thiotrichaceae bacterium]